VLVCGLAFAASQCTPAAASAGHARFLLLRQAMLACQRHGCSSTLRRLLTTATAEASGGAQQEQQWLQLLGSVMQLQASAGALAAAPALEAHWMVLQSSMEQLQAYGSGRSSSTGNLRGCAADDISTAAAYLSLVSILQQAADHSSWEELCAAYAPVQWLDWRRVHVGAGKLVQELPCCHGMPAAAAAGLPGLQDQPQREAALACAAAAAALQPLHPAPWKTYADLLFKLATTSAQPAADTAPAPQQPQQSPEAVAVLGAAAEAYCQHLAASANTGALTSPQQGLGVLIKLLQIILQQGDHLHEQLSAALSICPAAVWQGLTNQLLAQLQHSSSGVRGLIQQLLQGLAVVVPCAVLYPLVVEVRAAQEAGQEVSISPLNSPC
jgi:hypothetical protein